MSNVTNLGRKAFSTFVAGVTILSSVGANVLVAGLVSAASTNCPADLAVGSQVQVLEKDSNGKVVYRHPAIYVVGANNDLYYYYGSTQYWSWNKAEKDANGNNVYHFSPISRACFNDLSVPKAFPAGVNFRPGSTLVNRPADKDTLYAILPSDGVVAGTRLAKITKEAAQTLYGTPLPVVTIDDADWNNYSAAGRVADITEAKPHEGMLVSNGGKTWYVDAGNVLREVTSDGMVANGFQSRYAHIVTDSMLVGYTKGDAIMSVWSKSTDKTQAWVRASSSPTTPTTPSGSAMVSLAADNPAAMGIPQKATGVDFLHFVVKANAGDLTLNDLVVHRIGLGSSNDLASVYVYDGNTRLTSGRTVASDTNKVTFSNLKIALKSGESKTLRIVADLDTTNAGTGDEDGFEVVSVNGASVTGVVGNIMRVGASSVSAVTVDNSGSTGSMRLGASQAEVARFTVNAGSATYDVKWTGITLTNGGSLSNSYLSNLKLFVGGNQVAATPSMTGDKAVFTLSTSTVITKGDSKTAYVYADISGGRVNDNVKFYVDQSSDVQLWDTQYNAGVNLTNSWSTGDQTYTVTGGDLTLANNGPAAGTIARNVTNVQLQKFSFSAANNITVKSTKIWVYLLDAAGVVNTTSTNYDLIKNVKIVDLDNNNQVLVGPVTNFGTGTTQSGNGYYKVLTDNFDINAGQTRHLAVVADIDSAITTGFQVFTKIDWSGTNYVKYVDNSQYVDASNIVPNTLTGNNMTINGAQLTITRVTPPASASVVKGATQQALGLLLTPGTSDAVRVTSMNVRVYASSTAFTASLDGSTAGNTAGNTVVNTVSLWEEGAAAPLATQNLSNLSGTIGSGGYYYVTFNNLNYTVPAGVAKKLIVSFGLKDSISATTYTAADVLPSTDMNLETLEGKSVTNNSSSRVNATAGSITYLTVGTGGSITIAVDGSTPKADSVVSGSGPVTFTTYKLTPAQESFFLNGVALALNSTNYTRDIDKAFITCKDKAGATLTKTLSFDSTTGIATLTNGQLGCYLQRDQTNLITVGATLTTINGGAASGDAVKIGFDKVNTGLRFSAGSTLTNSFILLGESSNTTYYGASNSLTFDGSNINAQTLYKTRVSVAESDTVSPSHSTKTLDPVGVFTFTSQAEPGSSQNSVLGIVTVSLSGSLIANSAGNNTTTVYLYDSATPDAAHLMGSATVSGLDTGASNSVQIALTANNDFTGAKKVYVVVDTTDTDFSDTTNNEKLTTQLVSYNWNDGSTTATPVAGVPLFGQTYSY